MEEALYDTPGIARNDNKRQVMFALANPWMVRRTLPRLQT
ncbi:hypothetical protein EV687_1588 [Corticibacter populi]|nr:hypothetical protein EV687_1588 [Corticibacter populi]